MTTKEKLLHALTEHDRRESKKLHYNPYALGQYFERLDTVMADIEAGADIRSAIMAGFNDRLCDKLLKALGLPIVTHDEALRGNMVYKPVRIDEVSQ